jgi:hypothetical protein
MANPLKILTVLTASQAAKFEQGLDANGQKLTSVAAGTVSTDGVNYGQLTDVSGAIKSYVDAQDTALSGAFDTRLVSLSGAAATALAAEAAARIAGDAAVSGALKTYTDGKDAAQTAARNALSGAMKSYVDAADTVLDGRITSVSGAMKSYVDAQNTAQDQAVASMSGAMKTYIDAGDSVLDGRITSVSGAIVAYVDAENDAQDLAAAAVSGAMKSYIDAQNSAQDTAVGDLSGALKSYVDAADSVLDGRITSVSGAIKTYVDAQDTAISGAFDTRITALSGAAATALNGAVAAQNAARNALSSSLKSYVDAADGVLDARITSVSGAIKSYVDAQDNTLSSSLKTYVDAQNSAQDTAAAAVSGALKGAIDAEAQARADADLTFLKLDGSRTMSGELKMGGQDIVNAKSGSFSGDVTVGGNLTVNGQLTYVNSTNLEVSDKLITIAKGAADAAGASGAGFEIDGANRSFKWNNNYGVGVGTWDLTGRLQITDALLVNGYSVIDSNGAVLTVGADSSNVIVPSTAQLNVSGAMKLSGSSDFVYITSVARNGSGQYNVDQAIHALDTAVSGAANASNSGLDSIKSKYDALRCVVTGTLSSGTVTVNLTTEGGAMFATAEMANLALDVMVDADGSGFTNDLVAIKMFVDGAAVKVQIDAPATPSAAFRLIAVNEKDGGLN